MSPGFRCAVLHTVQVCRTSYSSGVPYFIQFRCAVLHTVQVCRTSYSSGVQYFVQFRCAVLHTVQHCITNIPLKMYCCNMWGSLTTFVGKFMVHGCDPPEV